jgi:hypothetical protein
MSTKKAGKKWKSSGAEEDDSTERFFNLYSKKCKELGISIPAKVREKINDILDEGEVLTDVLFFINF